MNSSKHHTPLTFLALALVAIMLVTTFVPAWTVQANGSLAPSPLAAPVAIYGDSLAAGWQDWSWNATRNFSNSSPLQSGSRSIAVTINQAWGALYLHQNSAVSTSGYTNLEFYIHGGSTGGQRLNIVANSNTSRTYPVTAAANTWTKVSVPLSNLGSPASITDLLWQDSAGKAEAKFYIDSIALVDASSGSAATPTTAPTKAPTQAPTQAPTKAPTRVSTQAPTAPPAKPATATPTSPVSNLAVGVYSDSLAAGWQDWSWGSSQNLSNATPLQSGSRSISVTISQAWGAFYLHQNTALNTSGYANLEFYINGGSSGGQSLKVIANGNTSRAASVTASANTWTKVSIPLSNLGSPASLSDLYWQDAAGKAQPVFYLDSIALTGASGAPGPTQAPTQKPQPTTTSQPTPVKTSTPISTTHFNTLLPGSKLPSDAECAAAVKARPENKRINATANATRGNQGISSSFFSGDDPRANTDIGVRVDGNFTGTTDEILQWAACKWGIDEDIVRAQAAKESWWRQNTKGDWTSDASRCAPGHGLGADGVAGQCPESFGILQNRYPYEQSAWPAMNNSTAFNADLAYGIWRVCYEGYEGWLNTVDRGSTYGPGDAWGCVGRWFAGRWHTQPAETYTSR